MRTIHNEKDFEEAFHEIEKQRSEGNLLQAIHGYKALLLYRLKLMNSDSSQRFNSHDAIVIERLGDLSWLFGWAEISNQLFESLQKISSQVNNHYFTFYIILKRVSLKIDLGNLESAFVLLQELFPYIGGIEEVSFNNLDQWNAQINIPVHNKLQENLLRVRLYYLFGSILIRLGQYQESIASYKYASKIAKTDSHPMIVSLEIPINLNMGRAYLEFGDLKNTKEILDLTSNYHTNLVNRVNYLELHSKYHMMMGNFGGAKRSLEEIVEICRRKQLAKAHINALCNLSNNCIFLNQVTVAENLLEKAKEIATQIDENSNLGKINILSKLAQQRASPILPEVSIVSSFTTKSKYSTPTQPTLPHDKLYNLSDFTQTDYFLSYFEDKALVFRYLLGNTDFEYAKTYLGELKMIFQSTDSKLIKNRLDLLQLLLAYYKDSDKVNYEYVESIKNYFIEQNLIPELWGLQRFQSWIEKDLNQVQHLKQHNQILLNQLAQSLESSEQSIYLLNKWTGEEEYLSSQMNELLRLDQLSKQKKMLYRPFQKIRFLKELDKLLFELNSYKHSLTSKVFKDNRSKFDFYKNRTNWLKRLFKSDREKMEIHFLILPDRALVVYSGFLFLKYDFLSISRIEIRKRVKIINEGITKISNSRGIDWKKKFDVKALTVKVQKEIDAIASNFNLLNNVNKFPNRITKIAFYLDDALNGIPFAFVKNGQKLLLESFAMSINTSRPKVTTKRKINIALLIGLSYRNTKYKYLSGVSKEIELIKETLQQDGILIKKIEEEDASKQNILALSQTTDLLHIACHGIFSAQTPDESGLILSNGDRLNLRDIWLSTHFSNIQHVTLSSCWAADNFILPNRWILSLPETFIRCGVKSVLACFWEVSDEVAVVFMKKFYEYMIHCSPEVALQKVQLLALNNELKLSGMDTRNPFYWAGFNIFKSES